MTLESEKFSAIVNELEILRLTFVRAKAEGSSTSPIEQRIQDLMGQMSDEQLYAYREYAKEREWQANADVELLGDALAEAETELERRKRGRKQ